MYEPGSLYSPGFLDFVVKIQRIGSTCGSDIGDAVCLHYGGYVFLVLLLAQNRRSA